MDSLYWTIFFGLGAILLSRAIRAADVINAYINWVSLCAIGAQARMLGAIFLYISFWVATVNRVFVKVVQMTLCKDMAPNSSLWGLMNRWVPSNWKIFRNCRILRRFWDIYITLQFRTDFCSLAEDPTEQQRVCSPHVGCQILMYSLMNPWVITP